MSTLEVAVTGCRGEFSYDWQFDVPASGVIGIFGPSGAGKTTLLRLIAGLDSPAAGRISCSGEGWLDSTRGVDWPTHRRPVGYVFQDARLFSHLSVAGNLQFAAQRAAAAKPLFDTVVEELALQDLLQREVMGLSGGERQRVAIARALLTQPQLLLMDEPLSANDLGRRGTVLPYLRRVARDFGIPTLYVSHSLDEMAALTEHMVVCRSGQVVAVGRTDVLLEDRDLLLSSDDPAAGALLTGSVAAIDPRLGVATLDLADSAFTVPLGDLRPGDAVRLSVQPRDVAIALTPPQGLSIRNILPVTVMGIVDPGEGAWADISLRTVDGCSINARITRAATESLALRSGLPCYALIKSAAVEHSAALDQD